MATDADWSHLNTSSLWQKINAEIASYYAFELKCQGMDAVTHKYGVAKMALQRRVCQVAGIQIVSRVGRRRRMSPFAHAGLPAGHEHARAPPHRR